MVTQGTFALAATKLREISLENSRQSPGLNIKTKDGDMVLSNVSYDSGYFDGVKLGGVRLDLDILCGENNSRCARISDGKDGFVKGEDGRDLLEKDEKGNYTFLGDKEFKAIESLLESKGASGQYGATGGFQAVEGGWYLPFDLKIPYKPGSFSDFAVESFAGTHDLLGGQVWGWYGKDGNTSRGRTPGQSKLAGVTTGVAIPVTIPFAVSDAIPTSVIQFIMGLAR